MRVQTRQLHHITLLSVVERLLSDPEADIEEVMLGFSRDHFNRFFRAAMGESLHGFIRRIRLERAAEQLLSGNSVTRVAMDAGYATPEAFTKAFRGEFGVAPKSFTQGSIVRRANGSKVANWGGRRAPLSIEPVTKFGAALLRIEDLAIAAQPFVGDYREIPKAWESLGEGIPDEFKRSQRWICVFHSDGMRTTERQTMVARLGYLLAGDSRLPGFQSYTVPGGSYVASSLVCGRQEHSEAWESFNRLWIPKSGPRVPDYPAFDLYDSFPAPFENVRANIHLALA
jgi:AraC family transcriptional regulator